MGSGFSKMKKQAKAMEKQMAQAQEELKAREIEGDASGMVKVKLSGDMKLKDIKISPECVDPNDIEALQDLIMSAFEDAHNNAEQNNPMNGMAGGLSGFPSLSNLGF